jgi:hypothetical protein
MKRITQKLLAVAFSFCFVFSVFAQESTEVQKTTFKFGGFAKTDFMFTQYNKGTVEGIGRDFHIPSTIPVADDKDVHRYSDFHVKESRFNFEASTDVNGKNLRAFVEMDFLLSGMGDERVSNSYNPRLRHFFLEYDKILVGQTWSTFMVVVLPDELDFLGAPEGVVFVRQPQARLTLGDWQFAVENPHLTYYQNLEAGRTQSNTGLMPDLIGRYNLKFGIGSISFAGIVRAMQYRDDDNDAHRAFGTGVTTGGKIKIGKRDDIRFQGTFGYGLGRYLAINFVNAAVLDTEGELKPVVTSNEYVSYLHYWTSKFRSSFSLSYFTAAYSDDDITSDNVNQTALSLSGNLLYSPASKLLFGIETIYGYRETKGGTSGDFIRVQASAKYAFSFKSTVAQ